jgi:hypothetical protein
MGLSGIRWSSVSKIGPGVAAEREGAVGRIPNGCKIALRDLIGEEAQVASAARLLALGEGEII